MVFEVTRRAAVRLMLGFIKNLFSLCPAAVLLQVMNIIRILIVFFNCKLLGKQSLGRKCQIFVMTSSH